MPFPGSVKLSGGEASPLFCQCAPFRLEDCEQAADELKGRILKGLNSRRCI